MSFLARLFRRRPTEAESAQALIERMRALRPDLSFDYRPKEGVIRTGDGMVSLANFHFEYARAGAADREQILHVFAQGIAPPRMPDTLAEARPRLLPAMRHLVTLDLARIASGRLDDASIGSGLQPFSDELAVEVVYDTEHTMASVGADQLAAWGLDTPAAMQLAIDNLRDKLPSRFEALAPGLWRSDYGDFYDAARALLPDHIHQIGVAGRPVAMIVNRACLLVAGEGDEQALAAMLKVARHMLQQEARPLSAEMLRLDVGRWLPWRPPQPAIAQALRRLQQEQLAGDYDAQQRALEQHALEKQVEIFVASHQLMQSPGGQLQSYCVVTRGVPTWLPRADLVMLVDPAAGEARPNPVRWEVFEREAGPLLRRLPCRLPRFEIRDYPDAATLARMEPAAL
ncbi:hypothetical protein [Ramlibacter sp.]|uniref:hypothetical protein n=1 Tax=Ramlibacter sp. TaxID=1917967 RepID=UPI0035B124E3